MARIFFKINEFDTYYTKTITNENRRYFHPISELPGLMFKFSKQINIIDDNILKLYDFKGVENWMTLSIVTLEREYINYDNINII